MQKQNNIQLYIVWWRYNDRTYNYKYYGITVRYLLPKPSIWCIITYLATTGHGLSCRLHEQRSLHILQTLSGTDEVILCTTVHPYEPREYPYTYGILYGGFNTRCYTLVHSFCFFKLFSIGCIGLSGYQPVLFSSLSVTSLPPSSPSLPSPPLPSPPLPPLSQFLCERLNRIYQKALVAITEEGGNAKPDNIAIKLGLQKPRECTCSLRNESQLCCLRNLRSCLYLCL